MHETIARRIVIYCGFLLSVSAFSIDITLPFFPLMAEDFAEPVAAMQLSVTLYIAVLGLGQLLFGPLCDRFGRRSTLVWGLCIFLLGTLICLMARHYDVFLFGRVVQGLGGAAAPVIARAMLRDLYSGSALAKSMALATAIFSIGPIVGPLLGVLLVELGGSWRAVFVGIAVYSGLLLMMIICLPETLKVRQYAALRLVTLLANAKRLVQHPQSRHFICVNGICLTSMILILSLAPVVYARDFSISGRGFALLFALHGFGIIVGQFLNHRMIPRFGVVKTAVAAVTVTAGASLLIALSIVVGISGPYLFSFLFFLFAIGFLSVISNSISMIMEPHGDIAGFASSFQGAITQIVAGTGASLIALLVRDSTILWALSLLSISLLTALMLILWIRPLKS